MATQASGKELAGALKFTITRAPNIGFGFSIVGGGGAAPGRPAVPVLITRVKGDSPAAKTGMIVGSAIVAVNFKLLAGLSHQEVVDLIKNAPAESVFHIRDAQVSLRHGAGTLGEGSSGAYIPARDSITQQLLVPVLSYERVETLHSYKAGKSDEISLERGDVVHVTRKGADGWCYGENQRTKEVGIFPGNFVMRIRNAPAAESIYQTLPEEAPASGDSDRLFRNEPLYASLDDPIRASAEPAVSPANPFTLNFEPAYATAERPEDAAAAAADSDGAGAAVGAAEGASSGAEAMYSVVRKPVYAVPNKRRPSAELPPEAFAAAGAAVAGPALPAAAHSPIAESVSTPPRGSVDSNSAYTLASVPDALQSSPSVRERAKRFEGKDGEGRHAPELLVEGQSLTTDDGPELRRADDDCYARLDDFTPSEAPPIPVRRYDVSQLPLLLRVTPPGSRMSARDDPNYEHLPDLKAHTDQGDSDDEQASTVVAFNKDTVTYDVLPNEASGAADVAPVVSLNPRDVKRLAKERKAAEAKAKKEAEKEKEKEKKRFLAEAKAAAEREKKERKEREKEEKEREKEEKERAKQEKERLKKEKSKGASV